MSEIEEEPTEPTEPTGVDSTFAKGICNWMLWTKSHTDPARMPDPGSNCPKEKELAVWYFQTIQAKRKNKLTPDQCTILETIQFQFPKAVPRNTTWSTTFEENFAAMMLWKENNNVSHLMVPREVKVNNMAIGEFVHTLRKMRKKHDEGKKTYLKESHIERLTNEGMVWGNVLDVRWHRNFMLLTDFIDAEGHPNVPQATSLGQWTKHQRKRYKANSLPEHQKELLNSVGFQWVISGNT